MIITINPYRAAHGANTLAILRDGLKINASGKNIVAKLQNEVQVRSPHTV
ncbi:hypothetical protein FACS1894152_3890 [Bacilli bacterium]|nr:hypothetical protein FACS1894152_3890 [Bacilli bacterium]